MHHLCDCITWLFSSPVWLIHLCYCITVCLYGSVTVSQCNCITVWLYHLCDCITCVTVSPVWLYHLCDCMTVWLYQNVTSIASITCACPELTPLLNSHTKITLCKHLRFRQAQPKIWCISDSKQSKNKVAIIQWWWSLYRLTDRLQIVWNIDSSVAKKIPNCGLVGH